MVDRAVGRQEAGADRLHQPPSLDRIPYERIPFDAPKLGKRQKQPDDFVADTGFPQLVPDVQ